MTARSQMVTGCIQWIAVIFIVCTDIDCVLADLTVVRFTLACAFVCHFYAIAVPFADLFRADSAILARASRDRRRESVEIKWHARLAYMFRLRGDLNLFGFGLTVFFLKGVL